MAMSVTARLATACPLDCPDTCSLEVTVEDGRLVSIDAGPGEPAHAGIHLRQGQAPRRAVSTRPSECSRRWCGSARRARVSSGRPRGTRRSTWWRPASRRRSPRTARRRSFPTSTTRPPAARRRGPHVAAVRRARRGPRLHTICAATRGRGLAVRRSGRCSRPTRSTSCTAGSSWCGARTPRSRTSTSRRSCSRRGEAARASSSSTPGARRWPGGPTGISRCGPAPTSRSCSAWFVTSIARRSSTARSSTRTRPEPTLLIAARRRGPCRAPPRSRGVDASRHRGLRRGARDRSARRSCASGGGSSGTATVARPRTERCSRSGAHRASSACSGPACMHEPRWRRRRFAGVRERTLRSAAAGAR